ncbi:hypothetical protein QQ73_20930 [Candidatus Endoriftia persephone str. Guaymas]|nr:hypothetical protein [Candidatus Endoriftia persephone str. Guaymas]
MTPATTIRELFAQLSAELNLTWYSDGEERAIQAEGDAPLVGPLNLARPQPIQVIGPPERHLLESLGSKGYRHYLELLFASRPAALIFTDGLVPTDACRTLAAEQHPFTQHLDEHAMDVFGLGMGGLGLLERRLEMRQ